MGKLHIVPGDQTVGEVVRRLAVLRGWSSEELARQAGLSAKTVFRIVGGKTAEPRRPTLRALATALGVDETELLSQPAYRAEPSQLDQIERKVDEVLLRLRERDLADAELQDLEEAVRQARGRERSRGASGGTARHRRKAS
jgi:transcriptional regulator with XRE-family HTH domain